jgi:hypothetical protein
VAWINMLKGILSPRRLRRERKHVQSLEKSDWTPGIISTGMGVHRSLTPTDRTVLMQLEATIRQTRYADSLDDVLDLAEALMLKGFMIRIRGADLDDDGIFGAGVLAACGPLNDSITVCRTILSQAPSAEAAETLARAALYLAEIYAVGVNPSLESNPQEARELLSECIELSGRLDQPERVKIAQRLLAGL